MTAPAQNKTGTLYQFTLPDGTVGRKRTLFSKVALPPVAVAYVYQHGGKWFCASVRTSPDHAMAHYQQIPATQVPHVEKARAEETQQD